MPLIRLLLGGLLAILPITCSEQQPRQRELPTQVSILFGSAPFLNVAPTQDFQAAGESSASGDPLPETTPVVEYTPPATMVQIVNYIMRTTDPETLIRYYWRDTPDVDKMLRIAKHESGLGKVKRDGTVVSFEACSADNPSSSAAGLFQTMGFHRHLAETMAVPEGEPQLTWANIAGPDCWDDVRLAWQLYDHGRGLSNWRGAY